LEVQDSVEAKFNAVSDDTESRILAKGTALEVNLAVGHSEPFFAVCLLE
jgi:hypothetical protein